MPAKFSSLPQIARLARKDLCQTGEMLERLIDKFLVGDLDCGDGVRLYTPMPFSVSGRARKSPPWRP